MCRYAAAMPAIDINTILTLLLALGLGQLAWLSVMLLRRSVSPTAISATLQPIIAIWVLLWPLYSEPIALWAGIIVLGSPILLAYGLNMPFFMQLRIAWSGKPVSSGKKPPQPHMWSLVSLLVALSVAAAFFQRAPEFGLGTGLAACLAFPAAALLDRTGQIRLGFPRHPEQTLIGHIVLIFSVSLICMWGIHLYHGIEWQRILVATLIAGMAASIARAFAPGAIMLPAGTLAIGVTLWAL